MHIMSTNFAKALVWKHKCNVILWRQKQRTPNTNYHHICHWMKPLMKMFCVRHCIAFTHFNHKFHEQSQARSHHWAAVDLVSSPCGTLVWLASQTQPRASQIEIWNTINQWSFCQTWEFQAPLHIRSAPLLQTFWTVHWNIYESIQSYVKQPISLFGFNTAQSWKSLLWPGCGKWNEDCR